MPGHSQCQPHKDMCAADSSLYLCDGRVFAALNAHTGDQAAFPNITTNSSPPPPSPVPSETNDGSTCISAPQTATCASYIYPDEEAVKGEWLGHIWHKHVHVSVVLFALLPTLE